MATYKNDDVYYATVTPVPPPPNAPSAFTAPPHDYGISNGPTRAVDSNQVKRLKEQGYTEGLAHSLNDVQRNFPLRIWVVDNSGSMATTDGHRIVPSAKNGMKIVPCTRWNVSWHNNYAEDAKYITALRLLSVTYKHA